MNKQKIKLSQINLLKAIKYIFLLVLYPQLIISTVKPLPLILVEHYMKELIAHSKENILSIAIQFFKTREEYLEYEATLDKIIQEPLTSIMGGINYSMDLEEMGVTAGLKFYGMQRQNLIISRNKFETIKNDYFISGSHRNPHQDLTRLWGRNYLKSKIEQTPYLKAKYNVPDYVIVVDDPHCLEFTISFMSERFPIVSELKNGALYFKKIIGNFAIPADIQQDLGPETTIGFRTLPDKNSIIRQRETDIYYIVDTEYKYFEFPPIPETLRSLSTYALKRFRYLTENLAEATYQIRFD